MPLDRPLRRGQIYWVDWSPARGSEQAGRRPALIVQADSANVLDEYALTVVVTISGSGLDNARMHVPVEPSKLNGLSKRSFVRCEQIVTITRGRLQEYIGFLEPRPMQGVDAALCLLLDLNPRT